MRELRTYGIWGLVLISTAYIGWLATLEVPTWFFVISFFILNPVCVFFLFMMWVKREEMKMIYTSMLWYWRQRREYKRLKKELESENN